MKDTLKVIHLEDDLFFTEYGVQSSSFINSTLNRENCDIIDLALINQDIEIPEFFISNGYSFENNQFIINDYGKEQVQIYLQMKKERVRNEIVDIVQRRLDNFARTRNYDSILSAATYATSTISKFQAEGQYAILARDITWSKLYEILSSIEAGTRPIPSGYSDIEPELPVLTWPE